jgi:hypothetical protein
MLHISKRLLIVCEDLKSSKLYFESFKRDEKLKRDLASVSIEVVHPKDHSPVGLVTAAKQKKLKAKRDRNPYSEIWIVLDRDYHANIDKAFNMAYGKGLELLFRSYALNIGFCYILKKLAEPLRNVMILSIISEKNILQIT